MGIQRLLVSKLVVIPVTPKFSFEIHDTFCLCYYEKIFLKKENPK